MDCNLSLTTGYKHGGSYVKDLYVTLPFRVVSVGQRMTDNHLYQMVMSSSPGILDGDNYYIDISLEKGSTLQLQSQSYQRLFNMLDKATQEINVTMDEDTSFAYVPHPLVPHKSANFQSKTKITIGKNSQVIMGEIITCGRKHHGEIFELTRFQNLTEIYHDGCLVVKDNVVIQPDLIPLNTIGNLDNYTHQGTLIFYSTKETVELDVLIDLIHSESKKYGLDMEIGLSALQYNGFVLRAMGNEGEKMFKLFLEVQETLWKLN